MAFTVQEVKVWSILVFLIGVILGLYFGWIIFVCWPLSLV